jgi:hypothetical protein
MEPEYRYMRYRSTHGWRRNKYWRVEGTPCDRLVNLVHKKAGSIVKVTFFWNVTTYSSITRYILSAVRATVVVKALRYKPEDRGFETRWRELIFSIYLILPAALGRGVYSASNRNEYQKPKNSVSGELSVADA